MLQRPQTLRALNAEFQSCRSASSFADPSSANARETLRGRCALRDRSPSATPKAALCWKMHELRKEGRDGK
jgi:hypothetical protein